MTFAMSFKLRCTVGPGRPVRGQSNVGSRLNVSSAHLNKGQRDEGVKYQVRETGER